MSNTKNIAAELESLVGKQSDIYTKIGGLEFLIQKERNSKFPYSFKIDGWQEEIEKLNKEIAKYDTEINEYLTSIIKLRNDSLREKQINENLIKNEQYNNAEEAKAINSKIEKYTERYKYCTDLLMNLHDGFIAKRNGLSNRLTGIERMLDKQGYSRNVDQKEIDDLDKEFMETEAAIKPYNKIIERIHNELGLQVLLGRRK